MIFFSTHGSIDDARGFSFALAGSHADPSAVLWGSELHEALAKMRGRIIVWADACHAGSLIETEAAKRSPATFLLACQAAQCSYGQYDDPARPHGYFVHAVCEALSSRAEVEEYVPAHVKALRLGSRRRELERCAEVRATATVWSAAARREDRTFHARSRVLVRHRVSGLEVLLFAPRSEATTRAP